MTLQKLNGSMQQANQQLFLEILNIKRDHMDEKQTVFENMIKILSVFKSKDI